MGWEEYSFLLPDADPCQLLSTDLIIWTARDWPCYDKQGDTDKHVKLPTSVGNKSKVHLQLSVTVTNTALTATKFKIFKELSPLDTGKL